MDKQFESFLDDLAGALKKAAGCAVWDIPATHRTKDSISAYRASLVMVSHVVSEVAAKHRAPADQTEENADVAVEQPVVEADVFAVATEPTSAADPTPIASDAERLFDSDADKPRRRRSLGA